MIDWEMAYRLRFNRGLNLPAVEGKYTDPRLFEIVKEIHELEKRIGELDAEIMRNVPEDTEEEEWAPYYSNPGCDD